MVVFPLGASMRHSLPRMVRPLYQVSIALSTHFASTRPASVRYDPVTIGSVPRRDLALLSSGPLRDAKKLDKMTQSR
jgi:hypothetical protein